MSDIQFLCPACTHEVKTHLDQGRSRCACGCAAPIPRFLPDGNVALDEVANPMASDRKAREQAERMTLEAEAAEPPSRRKIERLIERMKALEPMHINGKDRPHHTDLHGWILDGLDLSHLDLYGVNMSRASARGTLFIGANLLRVNGHGTVFEDARFDDAVMEGFNGCQACFRNANFSGVKATGHDGGVLGTEKWTGGLVHANLSESCCYGSARGLDIQEHDLVTPLSDEAGRPLMTRLGRGESHVCGICDQAFASIKARIEHAMKEGHGTWSVRTDPGVPAQKTEEPAVMDTRLWLQARGRRPILKGGKLRSTGPQLWGANITGMLRGHKDRSLDLTSNIDVPEDGVF